MQSDCKYGLEDECHSTKHGGGGNDSESICPSDSSDGPVTFGIPRAATITTCRRVRS